MTVMTSLFSKNRLDRLGNPLSIDIAYIGTFLGGTSDNVLPYPFELRLGQRFIIAVGNHIV